VDVRLGLVLTGWLVGWWLLWRVPRLDDDASGSVGAAVAPAPGATALVSVVIPARNEASSITTLLASLAAQSRPADEIVVVDDQSDDGTGALARAFPGVTVVAGAPLADGWTGKAWACHQGAAIARGDLLVFLDADVRLAPRALEELVRRHAALGGLVSVQPFHHMRRAYERLSAVFNIIGFMGVGAASPRRRGRAHGAFGPCLVTSREDHDLVGGHRAVRDEIVEDIALAHVYERAGRPVHCLGGGDLIELRMYPDGPGQLIEGWSKNFATGAGSVGFGRLALVGFWMTTVLISVQFVIEQSIGRADVAVAPIVLLYAMFACQFATMLRQLGNFTLLTPALYPALVGVFLLVFARSVYLTLVRRQVEWRGRSIPLSARHRVHGASSPASADPPDELRPPSAPSSRPEAR
jgi:4,4'-diaponeurosporenoate glycosyltransferase